MLTYNKLRKTAYTNLQDVRFRSYTVMGATFFTVLIFLTFAIRPVVFTLSDEIGLLNTIQANDALLRTNLYNLNLAEQSYNEDVSGDTDVLSTALPSSPATGSLFANMEAIAQKDSIEIDTIQYVSSAQNLSALDLQNVTLTPPNGTASLYFIANGQGSYTDFVNYVTDLEKYPRTFNILSVNLSGAPATEQSPQPSYGFSVTGYVYYLLP